MLERRDLNISNIISLARIILVIPFFLLLINRQDVSALIVGIIAAISDFFDGWFARKFGLITELGKTIDPIGDKLLMAAGAVALFVRGDMPLWFFIFVFARDIVILLGGFYMKRSTGRVVQSNIFGKVAFAVTAVVILGVIANVPHFIDYGYYIAALFLILSSISYARFLINFIKDKS